LTAHTLSVENANRGLCLDYFVKLANGLFIGESSRYKKEYMKWLDIETKSQLKAGIYYGVFIIPSKEVMLRFFTWHKDGPFNKEVYKVRNVTPLEILLFPKGHMGTRD
jgi:hypothetical protein